ncbi:hypothetical protein Pmani_013910 [Petrolisthes manimaculis]|uniref:Uncharacterized protein n=1 Tax=Petrolisthes manimaculis TaxID=1843537 RepID=A0AAE1UDN0_9EUCA|nr:hypothetical protein Pmani_013910 [Petrolisthes manimaculis]
MDDEGREEGVEGNLNGRDIQEEEDSTGITEGYSTGRDMEKEMEGCEGPEKRVDPRRGKCRRRRIDRNLRKRISVVGFKCMSQMTNEEQGVLPYRVECKEIRSAVLIMQLQPPPVYIIELSSQSVSHWPD